MFEKTCKVIKLHCEAPTDVTKQFYCCKKTLGIYFNDCDFFRNETFMCFRRTFFYNLNWGFEQDT